MAKRFNPNQLNLFTDWLVVGDTTTVPPPEKFNIDKARYVLAKKLAGKLDKDGEITTKFLTAEANRVFTGTQAEGMYSSKDAYDAMEVAFNIHLMSTERADWIGKDGTWAKNKAKELTDRIQKLPTQSRRDEEMEEFQQFSTPPALSFVANWVANISPSDVMMEPTAGTGDLAIWSKIAGADIVLNELSQRRLALLTRLFPQAMVFKENAEQLDNVLPTNIKPTVIVMNPPFSSSAGRVHGQRDTTIGAKHIEQALKRLENNGRLVSIVGSGMAADRPAFSKWWKEIKGKYNVRANIGISGKEYAKYGTTFDSQILVIDKTGATTQPILTGKVESVADLPILLEGIKNERQRIKQIGIEQTGNGDTQSVSNTNQPIDGISSTGADKRSIGTQPTGHGGATGASITDSQTRGESTDGNVANDRIGTGNGVQDGVVRNPGRGSSRDIRGDSGIAEGSNTVAIEAKTSERSEFSDSIFSNYTPQRLTIPGAQQHPGKLVQSAAMSAVEPPAPTYAPSLPANIIQDGLLSIAQLEAVVYAGQAHSDILPNGSRKGFFIGDGTGVGKGREISGIILDNMMQGRTKAVWVSFNEGLVADAKRDFAGIGGDPGIIFFQGKTKAGGEITQKDGILFTTYSTLRGGERKQANDQGQKAGKTRAQQIIDWLGKEFDGVIAFDEAHSMGNAIAIKGNRGVKKPSQQAIAGINLQRDLPNARIAYVSATGATEISNLSYADRLGLWGEGTPFADVNTFIGNVSKGGIASMELISRDMKALGMCLSRSLSYDGVSYERLEHNLTDLQEDIYNELAGAWQVVLNNVEMALEITQAGHSGNAKSAAMAQFWGAHQRFFNQIITAMQTPCVIDDIRQQLDAGNVAVIQLVNTNEAAQERIVAEATANDTALEDLDFTPRQMLIDYVRNGFPVAAYEESRDENGNVVYVPVRDSEGNQIFDREAIEMRDALLETLQQIRVPENPLDSIINSFGSDRVAEVTGRSRRFVQSRDDEGNLKIIEEKRGKNSSKADAEAFQNNKKDILIFSGAGGTGYSFHADNTAENQRKRIHYILQPGWQADRAVQGFGRTHRTNQAQEPHYVLPTTNLKAQKRFVSSIARRLDQLGALTRGQREATSQGMFTAADNLESEYASIALKNLFKDLYHDKTDLVFYDVTKQMGLNLLDENNSLSESKIPTIPQFLNRLLSLKTDMQNSVFNEFEKRLIEAVEYSKQHGLYDVGLQTLKALSIQKTRDDVVYEDKNTGAKTRYVELAVTNNIQYIDWDDAKKISTERHNKGDSGGWFVSEYGKNKGNVFYLKDIGERLNSEGAVVHRGVMYTIKKNDHRYIDNADQLISGEAYKNIGGKYQKVTLTRAIYEVEAEKLWKEQIANSPKTITKTEGMIVGVILPIWDRVEGSEVIKRLQTDDGEQMLGRMLGTKTTKQTLKNLGLDSELTNMSALDLFNSIKNGSNKAILSNGWEITTSKVNYEDRLEIIGRSSLTEAEKRVLKEQGAFVERIKWAERVFIPTGDNGVAIFERITASKQVVDLISKRQAEINDETDEFDQEYGMPEISAEAAQAIDGNGDDSTKTIMNVSTMEVNSMKNNQKQPFHEVVAERLIEKLKAGTAPWQKPWEPGEPNTFLPMNPTSGKRYKGINSIHLIAQDHDDPRWMTYKQANSLGAQVKKGEKGTSIQYWKFNEEQNKLDDNGKPVIDSHGDPVKVTVKLERPRVFFATVFNGEQIDGLPPIQRKEKTEQTWDAFERAEYILKASDAKIRHDAGNRAFYRPVTDSIHLPEKNQFSTADRYYATALHELGHWSGHKSRLNRDLTHPRGSEGYAREELRAEIASMITGDELGIGHDPNQHAAYVGSWIKALEEDPLEIFRAAADAEKIQTYLLDFEQKQIQTTTQEQEAHDDMNPYQTERARLLQLSTETIDSEFERAAKLAREQEERVKRDPNSTIEDIAAAREARKTAEVKATINDADFQKRIIENEQKIREQEKPQQQAVETEPKKERAYINVPFKEKNEAKQLGARWDRQQQSWFIPADADTLPFNKWLKKAASLEQGFSQAKGSDQAPRFELHDPRSDVIYRFTTASDVIAKADEVGGNRFLRLFPGRQFEHINKVDGVWKHGDGQAFKIEGEDRQIKSMTASDRWYLAVPYGERSAAKAAGAKWDKAVKSWYAGPTADMERLQRWSPENVPGQQEPAMSAKEEFAEALKTVGCIVTGEHPMMDGKKHRISVEGEKFSENAGSGFYVGHLDGHPAGYIKNNRTGIDIKWKSKGYFLDPQAKAKLQAEAVEKLAARAAEQERLHEATAQRVSNQAESLLPVTKPTLYMQTKGIQAHVGALTDVHGTKTYIPAIDGAGKQWTMQYVQEDGTKRFAKDSRKEGCFHAIGGMSNLAEAPALVIAEGYATAATLAEALNHATVAAFDSGNLPAVAQALHDKYPDKPIIIAGDDDRHLEMIQGVNPGRAKAVTAAQAVGGKAIFPIFAPGESAYPVDLEPITPQTYRNHLRATKTLQEAKDEPERIQLTEQRVDELKQSLLSDEQIIALERMKGHTDYNDIATKSELGKEGVERQVRAVVSRAVEKNILIADFYKHHQQAHNEMITHAKLEAQLEGVEPELWEIKRPSREELLKLNAPERLFRLETLVEEEKKMVRDYQHMNDGLRETLKQGQRRHKAKV
jgi:antirestriction protein ArdC/phage/plasmid primase-like uncharacterized protein/predicted RNA methylase